MNRKFSIEGAKKCPQPKLPPFLGGAFLDRERANASVILSSYPRLTELPLASLPLERELKHHPNQTFAKLITTSHSTTARRRL